MASNRSQPSKASSGMAFVRKRSAECSPTSSCTSFVALPIAFAEEHSDGAIATIGSCDDHTLIFAIETRDIEAEQVDQAFDQVDLAIHRFATAVRALDAVAEGRAEVVDGLEKLSCLAVEAVLDREREVLECHCVLHRPLVDVEISQAYRRTARP